MLIENEQNEQKILYQTRSEEVQEIMGRILSWIIRWGILIISAVIIGLVIGSNFIKYPDKILTNISITSDKPPAKIVAPSMGLIQEIIVKQNDTIAKNDVVIVLESNANTEDVMSLRKELVNVATT